MTVRRLHPPILPVLANSQADLPYWANQLTQALERGFSDVANRVEELNLTEGIHGDIPDAVGTRGFYYDETNGILFFDNGTWIPVGGGPGTERTVGFENQTDSDLSWVDGTRTLTITPGESGFTFYVDGTPFTKTSAESIQIADAEGLHHIYYDNTGALVTSQAVTFQTLIYENAYVANVYWDDTNSKAVFVGEERHGLMDPDVHYWIHSYGGGTAHGSGLTLGDILADENGSSDTHAELSVASGTYVDEDIIHSFAGYAAPAEIPVMYKTGAGLWRIDAAGTAPIKFSGGVPQINTYSGTWGQTSVSNTKFFLMHIVAINDHIHTGEIVAIQGEAEYATLGAAQDGALTEVSSLYTDGLPMPEFLFLGTVIFQYNTAYGNSYKCRIRATEDGSDYVNWLLTELRPGAAPSSHALLSDRNLADQHHDTAITITGTHDAILAGATDVDDALTALDDLDDSGLPLSGTHTGLLSGETTVADAMDVLDDLTPADLIIMDDDVGISGTHGGLLGTALTVANAMEVLDDLDDSDIPLSATPTGTLLLDVDLADAMETVDGFRANGLTFDNDVYGVKWGNKLGTGTILGWKVNQSDILEAGESIVLQNDDYLRAWNSTGLDAAYLVGLSAGNVATIGSGTYGTVINSANDLTLSPVYDVSVDGNLYLQNGDAFQIEDSGGTAKNVATVDGSDILYVGSATLDMELYSTGVIDAQDNDITTTGDVSCEEVEPGLVQLTKSKSLPDNTITEIFRVYTGNAPGANGGTLHYVVEATDGSAMQVQAGMVTFNVLRTSGGVSSGTPVETGVVNTCSTGTLTVTWSPGSAGADHVRFRTTVNSSLTSPTITMYMTVIGSHTRAMTWS